MTDFHRIEDYLATNQVPYEIITHEPTASSMETARAAHINPHRLAKAVLLESDDGPVAAGMSADRKVCLGPFRQDFGEHVHLADEATVRNLFSDCDPGTMPCLTTAWGVEMVWEDELLSQPDLYLETGDDTRLLHVETRALAGILVKMPHCHFSKEKTLH